MESTQHASSHRRNVKRRMKLIVGRGRHYHVRGGYASREARGRKLLPTPPLMHFMKYLPCSVISLLTLKYQGKPEILFGENLAPLWCLITTTGFYFLTVEAMKQITTVNHKWFQIASRAALASGLLSVLSCIAVFLPYPVSFVPLMIWIPLPVALAWPILKDAYSLLKRGITSVTNKRHAIAVWDRECNSTKEASSAV